MHKTHSYTPWADSSVANILPRWLQPLCSLSTHMHMHALPACGTRTHVHIHTSAYIPMHTCTHVLFSLNQPSLGCTWRGACMIHPSPLTCGFLGKLSSDGCAVQLATSGGRALIGHFVRVIYSISASVQDPGWAHVWCLVVLSL